MYVRYSDILLTNHETSVITVCSCYCVDMVSVTSASRYQSKSSMYIRGLIPGNSTELAEAVPNAAHTCLKVAK